LLQDVAGARMLDVQRQALLPAVHPDEVRRQAFHGRVVAPCGVAGPGALDLDDARAEVGELARRERPGDHLLQRDDRDAVEWSHSKRTVSPGSGTPENAVLQISPGCTGCASVRVPVVTNSPGASRGACDWRASTETRCESASNGLPSTFSPRPRSTSSPAFLSSTVQPGRRSARSGISRTGICFPTTRRPCRPLSAVQSARATFQAGW